ncbi:hypothetical protein ES708_21846 [subsurface metagenome]
MKHFVIDVPVDEFIFEMIYSAIHTLANFGQQVAILWVWFIVQRRYPARHLVVFHFPKNTMAPHLDIVLKTEVIDFVRLIIILDVPCRLIGTPFCLIFTHRPLEMVKDEVPIAAVAI